jgi:Mg-chelatase subunit ChlD
MSLIPPTVVWAESFKIVDGQYNAVAYIENRNIEAGTPALTFTLRLLDEQGVIVEQKGTTVLPAGSVYPIFLGRIMTGDRIPTKTTVTFDDNLVWLPGEKGRDQFTLNSRELANVDSKPRLTAQLYNNSLDEAREVEVVATIFNAAHEPLTAAATIIDFFPGRSTQEVVFTWPEPIAKTLRSCEIPTDVVLAIDLSGSMNNDNANPPEPISSVLRAAEAFALRLKANDQIGLITYASNALVRETLTSDNERVSKVISLLAIDPKEERGTTNTGDAIKRMREELQSERHSENARKVAILLTDGLATAPEKDPEIYAQSEAQLLKETDTTLFTIGLGAGANDAFLKTLASSDTDFYKAPTINELESIYTAITASICEDGASVIEIIPKAKTSFSN